MPDPIDSPDAPDNTPPFGRVVLASLQSQAVVVVVMPPDERGRPREALVLLDHEGAPRAYINRCKHVPIPLDGGSRQFFSSDKQDLLCGTHGARYRLHDGFCTKGPCRGERLDALRLRVENGIIELRER